jgi:hypothetical protein
VVGLTLTSCVLPLIVKRAMAFPPGDGSGGNIRDQAIEGKGSCGRRGASGSIRDAARRVEVSQQGFIYPDDESAPERRGERRAKRVRSTAKLCVSSSSPRIRLPGSMENHRCRDHSR